ncbi:hypothetical protein P4U54_24735 [Bacillus paramycoides]|nr:hypothetical protein [Bacillus sp. H1a]MED1412474.1 hypothetical protein [Bacillus paramycoides]MED1464223.1 hypothetical protein [Bacillus paramycoides]MED1495227.1 hypothetical protein [Bacillus paramycoides]
MVEVHCTLKRRSFFEAEEYHQHFYKKNPVKYAQERKESGREEFIKENWKKIINKCLKVYEK